MSFVTAVVFFLALYQSLAILMRLVAVASPGATVGGETPRVEAWRHPACAALWAGFVYLRL